MFLVPFQVYYYYYNYIMIVFHGIIFFRVLHLLINLIYYVTIISYFLYQHYILIHTD